MTTTSPRDIAVLALKDRGGNVTARLDSLLAERNLADRDRALARELALGAERHRGTLHAVLRAFLDDPDRRPPGVVTEILEVGVYQLLFLDRVPGFAAVDEAVKQAVRMRHKRQSGLVNGVLRTIERSVSEPETGAPPKSPRVVPIGVGRFRRLDRDIFADPQAHPDRYLAAAWSLPETLATRWVERFGLDDAAVVAAHAGARPPLIARVNTQRASVPEVIERLAAEGVEALAHENGLSVVLPRTTSVGGLSVFAEGLIQPQDPTASAVAPTLAPKPGGRVLDFCAAPGTKTVHLAERMENRGEITAVDVSADRLERITENCERMGVTIVRTLQADDAGTLEPRGFDAVLADVPCSNTGVLARRAEARWRFGADKLRKLVLDQRMIAQAAAHFTAPGGRMVYSTCSIEPEECGDLARWLAGRVDHIELESEKLTLPGGADDPTHWHDGGYVAVFRAR